MTNTKIPDPLPKELPVGTRWRGNIGQAGEHEWELLKPAIWKAGKYYVTDYVRTRSFGKPDPARHVYTNAHHVFFNADEVMWDTYWAVAGGTSAVKDAILSEAIFPQQEVFGTQPPNEELPLVLPLGALTKNGSDYSGMLLVTADDDPPAGVSADLHAERLRRGGGVYYCGSGNRGWGCAQEVDWANLTKPPNYTTTRNTVRQAAKIEIGAPIKATKQYSYDPYANYMLNNPDAMIYKIMVSEGRTKPEQPRVGSNHPSTWPEDSGDELYCS